MLPPPANVGANSSVGSKAAETADDPWLPCWLAATPVGGGGETTEKTPLAITQAHKTFFISENIIILLTVRADVPLCPLLFGR